MRGQENCPHIDSCNKAAYQISGYRQIAQESLAKTIPASPEALGAVTTPRNAHFRDMQLENSAFMLQELDDWAGKEAARVEGGCEGCPIISLCVQIEIENL